MEKNKTLIKKTMIIGLIAVCFTAMICSFVGIMKKTGMFVSATNAEAKATFLMDSDSGIVIEAKNENARLPVASMVKTMTLLLTFEAVDSGVLKFDGDIVASAKAQSMGGSQVFLDAGSKYKVKDLIKSVAMASGNDAAVALAEALAGSEEAFVLKMNERASQLGLANTNFVNCTGLPAPESYSSAKDISIIMKNLIKHKEYFNFTQTRMDELIHPSGRKTELVNTNKLIRLYKNCDAGKTGSTSEAGFCLTSTAKVGSFRLIGTVIGSKTGKERFDTAINLFEYGFINYENKNILNENDIIKIETKKAIKNEALAKYEKGYYSIVKKGDTAGYKVENVLDKALAPKKIGDKVGEAIITDGNGTVVDKINIVLTEDLAERTYLYNIKEIIKFMK